MDPFHEIAVPVSGKQKKQAPIAHKQSVLYSSNYFPLVVGWLLLIREIHSLFELREEVRHVLFSL
jgi:hypothetical protein